MKPPHSGQGGPTPRSRTSAPGHGDVGVPAFIPLDARARDITNITKTSCRCGRVWPVPTRGVARQEADVPDVSSCRATWGFADVLPMSADVADVPRRRILLMLPMFSDSPYRGWVPRAFHTGLGVPPETDLSRASHPKRVFAEHDHMALQANGDASHPYRGGSRWASRRHETRPRPPCKTLVWKSDLRR